MNNEIVIIGKKPYVITRKYKNGNLVVSPIHYCEDLRGNLEEFTEDELTLELLKRKNEKNIVVQDEMNKIIDDALMDRIINEVVDGK